MWQFSNLRNNKKSDYVTRDRIRLTEHCAFNKLQELQILRKKRLWFKWEHIFTIVVLMNWATDHFQFADLHFSQERIKIISI